MSPDHCPLTPDHCRRRGLSLLEVLISMFVLLIGVLGVAALIPVGRYNVQEATKADRSGALGRAALREIKVRNMLDPVMWVTYKNGNWVRSVNAQATAGAPVVYDPLLLTQQVALGNGTVFTAFPYAPNTNMPPNLTVTRSMLAPVAQPWSVANPWSGFGTTAQTQVNWAKNVFVWPDDVSFNIPADPNYRTSQMFSVPNDTYGRVFAPAWPDYDTQVTTAQISWNDCVGRAIDGSYSWMFTVSPALQSLGVSDNHLQLYTISAVVFYQRDLTYNTDPGSNPRPSERWVTIPQTVTNPVTGTSINNLAGFGWGGGSFAVQVPSTTAGYGVDYLYVKPGDWLAVMAQTTELQQGFPSNPTTIPSANQQGVLRWYKVVNAGEVLRGTLYRTISVVGADCADLAMANLQNSRSLFVNNNKYANGLQAVLVSNVVSVHTMTVQMDRSAVWDRDTLRDWTPTSSPAY